MSEQASRHSYRLFIISYPPHNPLITPYPLSLSFSPLHSFDPSSYSVLYAAFGVRFCTRDGRAQIIMMGRDTRECTYNNSIYLTNYYL